MGVQNIINTTLGAVAGAATLGAKEMEKAKAEKEAKAAADYAKTPEGRIKLAYDKMKESELTKEAEKEAARRLELEKLTTKKRRTKEEYRKILSLKLKAPTPELKEDAK